MFIYILNIYEHTQTYINLKCRNLNTHPCSYKLIYEHTHTYIKVNCGKVNKAVKCGKLKKAVNIYIYIYIYII